MKDLTEEQINKALEFYKLHKSFINTLLKEKTILNYPPTETEDKNDPRLWKANHWKWFIYNFQIG